jgi:pilus assembly protein CpaD
LAAALLITACAPMPDNYPLRAPKPVAQVIWTGESLPISFASGAVRPAAGEMTRLLAFLEATNARRAAHVYVDAASGAADSTLAKQRTAALTRHLAQLGIGGEPRPSEPGLPTPGPLGAGANTITVSVGRYVAVPPRCPDWSKPELGDYTNTSSSNFGCASAVNLSLMVADPLDLARGQPLGDADGARMTRAIGQYRAGKLPAPPKTSQTVPSTVQPSK